MQDFSNKNIVLGVCGGIAAYKSVYLVRELTRLGANVRVVMTDSAQEFITPMTMQAVSGHEVRTTLFDSQAERAMGHIELARWADYLVIAPLSANCMAKLAIGLADDLLSTLYLVTETPVIICPAMNRSMWAHPATKTHCETLVKRGVVVVGPEEGMQACGEQGYGRMSEVADMIDALRLIEVKPWLKGKEVLITAGPTREAIDPVRYLSNRSSGKMGYALAKALYRAGANVTLISGPTVLKKPEGVFLVPVETAEEMLNAVKRFLKKGAIFIGAAAVADYHIKTVSEEKIKKNNQKSLTLELKENPDILSFAVQSGKPSFVVGFAAETSHIIEYAHNKLIKKKLDLIIANEVGKNKGFDEDVNQVSVISKENQVDLASNHKVRLAGQIVAIIASTLQNSSKLKG
ncbi:bifunctional phosphopantothenoylcysteine decarboxylase/phosphopantothenate--cysteine ligase CoaBC [Legionella impletisoli]|uniref:Coenzyme A biosynthesis bifunctional protein CoaBC n=1 Tax=Legionella impletisoli TaxID=343510 RepID=A0A917JXY2_9GAMM|nr:bifunctional phosphopantothenoylcysteine decarboxylase/phosphopantothenate--cysteine ligase CoaBC [Legionella impletisoli]GGI88180.1 phosphopantothenate synthase [Legionella impletisoli]